MNISKINGYTLNNLGKINVLLGKNGCGKSTLLRQLEEGLSSQGDVYGKTKYITPERGGSLIYEAGIEQNLAASPDWLQGQRRRNLTPNFRQQSVSQYRKLETLVLREYEKDNTKNKFGPYVARINTLLDNIEIRRDDTTFKIFNKGTDSVFNAETISSGESELISLGIECLIFSKEIKLEKENILFLDEPDVHLHPDLQVRLMHFLKELADEHNFRIVIATHSTAILGALESYSQTHIAFLTFNQKSVEFKEVSDVCRRILPVFGAHPLSNIFNEAPVLLVEGDDDERIWQQVVRSTIGAINIYPCSVDSISNMNEFEREAQTIIKTVYDNAKGYSLRDRDDGTEEINDLPPIIRMKLSCRSSENLLLTNEVLDSLGVTWEQVQAGINDWLTKNTGHNHHARMTEFQNTNYDRKSFNLKDIRNDLMGIIGSPKPWEVVVGKAIAKLAWDSTSDFNDDGKLISYLGKKVVENLIPIST